MIYLVVRGGHVNIEEIDAAFRDIYGEEPGIVLLGSLEDLYKLTHDLRDQDPDNVMARLGLFYPYYSLDGQTALPPSLYNDRYPAIKLVTGEIFLPGHQSDGSGGLAYCSREKNEAADRFFYC